MFTQRSIRLLPSSLRTPTPIRTLTTSFPRFSVQAPDAVSGRDTNASNPPGVRKPVEPNDPAFKKQQDAHLREKDSGSPDKVAQNDTPESAARATGSGADAGAGITGDAGMNAKEGDAEGLKKSKEVGKEAGSAGSVPRSG